MARRGPTDPFQVENPPGQMTASARTTFTNVANMPPAFSSAEVMVKPADVTDGTSNTYLIGEKYAAPTSITTAATAATTATRFRAKMRMSHGGAGGATDSRTSSGHARLWQRLRFWQRPRHQSQHGVLRRFGSGDSLHDRSRNPPPPMQSQRRPAGRSEEALDRAAS